MASNAKETHTHTQVSHIKKIGGVIVAVPSRRSTMRKGRKRKRRKAAEGRREEERESRLRKKIRKNGSVG